MNRSDVKIKNFKEENTQEVVNLWNLSLIQDNITFEEFEKKVIKDPNLDPCGVPVAEKDGKIVGFAISIVRKVPNNGLGLEEDRGWVTMIFIHPEYRRQGIGTMLLNRCVEFIRSKNRKVIWVCGLTGSSPNYFFPGIDVDRYKTAVELFKKIGFVINHTAVQMERTLEGYFIPEDIRIAEENLNKEGITVRLLHKGKEKQLLDFLWEHFPGDWHRHTEMALSERGTQDRFFIALKGKEIVGYCHYEGDHFGPFFVRPDLRYKKIGAVIFHKCVERMKNDLKLNKVWFRWADEPKPADFYRRYDMKVTRRYAIMRLDLI
ncbi:MAG: GNAT family N-acetyltransferase [candidate division WOR-3 bacterium]|nr:GNAT family N-acetyltransferase [candidate division WOR-3 bacterium]